MPSDETSPAARVRSGSCTSPRSTTRATGVRHGADLYALNPGYRDPGRRRSSHATRRQPVRNGDVANLVTDLLGLEPVGGSQLDAQQDLDVR